MLFVRLELFIKAYSCVRKGVEDIWERAVSVQFELLHCLVVKLESLKSNNKDLR